MKTSISGLEVEAKHFPEVGSTGRGRSPPLLTLCKLATLEGLTYVRFFSLKGCRHRVLLTPPDSGAGSWARVIRSIRAEPAEVQAAVT